MKAILTSFLGGLGPRGKKEPSLLMQENGLLDNLKEIWIDNAKGLIICADPHDHNKNDIICRCLNGAFPMSGLSILGIESCDDRNPEIIEKLEDFDLLILAGGHVPTQNEFMKSLRLRERLRDYKGILIAWSAGSMNCADIVYAGPELEGEAIDLLYQRWISGLGITDINIFPHFQSLKDDYLDGMRLIEDITYADSMGHEILALNDGSYILIDDGKTTLYGEAYMIKDGKQELICSDGEFIDL